MMRRRSRPGYLATIPAIANADMAATTAKLPQPTLVIGSDLDAIVPEQQTRHPASVVPDARYALINGVGHFPCAEKPAELAALIDAFLGEER